MPDVLIKVIVRLQSSVCEFPKREAAYESEKFVTVIGKISAWVDVRAPTLRLSQNGSGGRTEGGPFDATKRSH